MELKNKNARVPSAEPAMRRAAGGVLRKAIDANSPIPIWNGSEVVCEVPSKQLEQLDALESCSGDAPQDQ